MRTTGGAKRRRRHKHLSSAASPDSPLSPRNLTREFAAINTSSESDGDMKLTTSTPLQQPLQKSAKRISRKSANLPTPVFSAVDSVTNNGITTKSSRTQEKSRQYTKSTDSTDNYVKKRTVETFDEYSRVVTTKSSQSTEKRDKFSTPPKNEALLDVSR